MAGYRRTQQSEQRQRYISCLKTSIKIDADYLFYLLLSLPQVLDSAKTTDILSCNIFEPFWISWYENYLKVGTGTVLESNVILSFDDPNSIPIGGITFAVNDTSGSHWYFSHFTG